MICLVEPRQRLWFLPLHDRDSEWYGIYEGGVRTGEWRWLPRILGGDLLLFPGGNRFLYAQ